MTEEHISREERADLLRVVRNNEKISIQKAKLHSAAILAEFERQISAKYPVNHPAWRSVTDAVEKAAALANAKIADECEKLGIVREFAPRVQCDWSDRGENAYAERRAELRIAAKAAVKEMEEKQSSRSGSSARMCRRSSLQLALVPTQRASSLRIFRRLSSSCLILS